MLAITAPLRKPLNFSNASCTIPIIAPCFNSTSLAYHLNPPLSALSPKALDVNQHPAHQQGQPPIVMVGGGRYDGPAEKCQYAAASFVVHSCNIPRVL